MAKIKQAKISTILASGDKNVDLISVNDEMVSEFKHKGYLVPLEEMVMTEEARTVFPQKYLENICEEDGHIYSVPFYDGCYDVLGKSATAKSDKSI